MKAKALPADLHFLKQRAVIESVNDILASVCDVERSRHRDPWHGLANALGALIAYNVCPQNHTFLYPVQITT